MDYGRNILNGLGLAQKRPDPLGLAHYADGGVTPSAADPLDFTGRYNTALDQTQQQAFDKWADTKKAQTGRDPRGDKYDYDVNGYFLSGAATDERGHGTDLYKKPNHPTFSDESIYHGKDGYQGGQWIQAGKQTMYNPSQTNLRFRPINELQQYFKKVEPDVMLMNPPTTPPLPPGLRKPPTK